MLSKYVAALQDGLRAAYRHARAGLQGAAMHQRHDYDGKVQRREYQAGDLVWIHDVTLERRRRDRLLSVVHVDRLEVYIGKVVPAWMVADQRGCMTVMGVGSGGVIGTSEREKEPSLCLRPK